MGDDEEITRIQVLLRLLGYEYDEGAYPVAKPFWYSVLVYAMHDRHRYVRCNPMRRTRLAAYTAALAIVERPDELPS